MAIDVVAVATNMLEHASREHAEAVFATSPITAKQMRTLAKVVLAASAVIESLEEELPPSRSSVEALAKALRGEP